jgi:hypothetical protein
VKYYNLPRYLYPSYICGVNSLGGLSKSCTSVTAHEPVTKSDGHWSVLATSCDLLGHELGDIFGNNFHVFGDILMGNYVFGTIKTIYSVKKMEVVSQSPWF